MSGTGAFDEAGTSPASPAQLRPWLTALADLNRALSAGEPLDALLAGIAEQACRLVGFEMCAVMLADDERGRLTVRGYSGLSPEYVHRLSRDQPLIVHPARSDLDSPSARAFRTDCRVTIADVVSAAGFEPWRALAQEQGYRALMAVPLRQGRRPIGSLVGYSTAARSFSRDETELMELLAEQTGVAVHTAGLRSAQQSMIERLSTANTELQRQRQVLEWAEDQHGRLMQTVVNDVGVEGVVAALARVLSASVTLEDVDGRVLATAAERKYYPPPALAARRGAALRQALDELAAQRQVVSVPAATPAGGAQQACVAPVVLAGRVVALLWVSDLPTPPNSVERRGLERFAVVVALELLKRRNALEVEQRLSRDLLSDLVLGDVARDLAGLLERARAMGHDLSVPHAVLVARIDDQRPLVGLRAPMTARLAEAVHAAVRQLDPLPLVGAQGEHVVVLVPEPGDASASAAVAETVQQSVARLASPGTVSVVIGRVVRDLAGFAGAYRAARGAARLLSGRRRGAIVALDDLGVYALLLEHPEPAGLAAFADRLLAPLVVSDERRHGDLIPTLRCWLQNSCSTGAAAKELVVHNNTVTYRLNRVEELLGRRLREPDSLLQVQLALAVHDVAGSLTDQESAAPRALLRGRARA